MKFLGDELTKTSLAPLIYFDAPPDHCSAQINKHQGPIRAGSPSYSSGLKTLFSEKSVFS